ncbi:terminase [Roseateles sp.]|uniref:terminase n=1 Tax=Roseateles sp. TaxID=1971397 RepID=UPI002E09C372|nr:terminase [Roseateles sp.]
MSTDRLLKRLQRVETKAQADLATDIRSKILAARRVPPAPQHSRAELEALAAGPGIIARVARGLLRIGHVAPVPCGLPLIPGEVLPAMAGRLYAEPLAFVLFAFDFGVDPALRLVKLPAPWSDLYDSEFGVEAWVAETFDDISRCVTERGFDGTKAVDAVRISTASGHGIGKSSATAMLVNFLMTTRPNARGVITANTAPQLESKTWAELAKWTRRSVFAEWFTVTTGRGSMKMVHNDAPESWNCFGQTAAEERAESFAGLHAADSTAFFILDEASAIPAAIWDVAEGGMTDGEPMMFAFGNPTRTGTKFFETFNGQRHRWITRQVDSRTCQLTNKKQIQEWVADYGEDSDFVKVRVRGIFPSASSLQFIGRQLVDDAMARELPSSFGETVVVGVDPARFGADSSVIYTRVGRDARTWPPIRLQGADTMTLASRVAEHVNTLRRSKHRVMLNVDGGGVGGGVIDRLRSLGFEVNEVQFGSRALDPRRWANRRAEIWGALRDWLAIGALPRDEDLATDLTATEYGYNQSDAILLESKASMKSRGLASPDTADALAVTFALPTPVPSIGVDAPDYEAQRRAAIDAYDPYAFLDAHDPYAIL